MLMGHCQQVQGLKLRFLLPLFDFGVSLFAQALKLGLELGHSSGHRPPAAVRGGEGADKDPFSLELLATGTWGTRSQLVTRPTMCDKISFNYQLP